MITAAGQDNASPEEDSWHYPELCTEDHDNRACENVPFENTTKGLELPNNEANINPCELTPNRKDERLDVTVVADELSEPCNRMSQSSQPHPRKVIMRADITAGQDTVSLWSPNSDEKRPVPCSEPHMNGDQSMWYTGWLEQLRSVANTNPCEVTLDAKDELHGPHSEPSSFADR
jgi:hypothetical protein